MSDVIQYRLIVIDYEAPNHHKATYVKTHKKFDEAVINAIDSLERYYKHKRITKQSLANRRDKLIGNLHARGCYVDTDKGVIQLVFTVLQEDLR